MFGRLDFRESPGILRLEFVDSFLVERDLIGVAFDAVAEREPGLLSLADFLFQFGGRIAQSAYLLFGLDQDFGLGFQPLGQFFVLSLFFSDAGL